VRYRSPACSGAGRPPVRQIIGLGLCVSLLLTHPLHASSDHVTRRTSLDSEQRCVHVVSSGESIQRIATRYSPTRRALLTTNRLVSRDRLRVSQRLEVPCRAGMKQISTTVLSNEVVRDVWPARAVPVQQDDSIRQHKLRPDRFRWPVNGPVSSGFGRRGFGGWHSGVDIKAPQGQPIRAAAAGTVLFSGWQSSYGRVVKIAHADGFTTVYAHNLRNFVKAGDRVQLGTVIGAVGQTGRATANHLHFEVRREGRAQNPLPLLARREPTPLLAQGD
jgi:murein DD-endopeptidase MepM/ murein hydrolase activator NlpD